MIVRYAVSIVLGAAVTASLLFIMHLMIATGQEAITDAQAFRLHDFVHIQRSEEVAVRETKPEKPPAPEVPPEVPEPELTHDFDKAMAVSVSAPAIEANLTVGSVGYGASDGEYLPIVKVSPVYPARALARHLEGYVLVEFTVTQTGAVRDVVVLESTAALFEKPAIEAALQFKYRPRIVDGVPVEVAGVRNRITFEMARS